MKKIKTTLIALFVCALGYGGYSAYDYMTMTEAERFLLENIEALAQYESYEDYGCVGIICRDYCETNSSNTPILWHARNEGTTCRICGNPW